MAASSSSTTTTTATVDPCAKLLRVTNPDSDTFTTRVIDRFIHHHPDYYHLSPFKKLQHHKQIQQDILERVRGCEERVFNDPNVRYTFRPHFNGITGTMSNILTSGYFTLYNTLLQAPYNIQVSAEDDLKTIYKILLSLEFKNGVFLMDTDEFNALKNIIRILKGRIGNQYRLFTHQWFSNYRQFLIDILSEALENYTYMKEHPEARTFSRVLSWKLSHLLSDSAERRDILNNFYAESYNYGLYEYYPPYLNPNVSDILITDFIQKLPYIDQFFNEPESVRQVQYPEPPIPKKTSKTSKNKNKSNTFKGGSRQNKDKRKKRVKRKGYTPSVEAKRYS